MEEDFKFCYHHNREDKSNRWIRFMSVKIISKK